MPNKQTASMEDYLEAIAKISEVKTEVGVTEISKRLGVKKPSVTIAIRKLSEDDLVEHRKYGSVALTQKGQVIARDVAHRHEILFRFLFEVLGVEHGTAQEDACKLEHGLSPVSMQRLTRFVEFALTCPQEEPTWRQGLEYYLKHGKCNLELLNRGHQKRD
ncbi:MAG: metal-dependent transcriptional regulator [Chloroflexota bacterium]|nr:metal-dependent transcriptional regulator [Chloroflexota bacterium]